MTMQPYVEDVAVGAELPPVAFGPVTTRHLVMWAAAAGDFHEIHYDREYARAQGVPDVVVHGPFKLALMGRLLTDWAGPQGRLRRLTCRYAALDVPGARLRCTATVTAVQPAAGEVELELTVVDQQERRTALGAALVQLPRRSSERRREDVNRCGTAWGSW